MNGIVIKRIMEHKNVTDLFLNSCADKIENISREIINCIKNGGKVIIFGNGGSAADAQHFAAELVNRFQIDRKPIPAIALTTDTSLITSAGNDFGFGTIFERQVDALANKGDVVIGISTSGKAENVLRAFKKAKDNGAVIIYFTGETGGRISEEIRGIINISLNVPSKNTSRIQEFHELSYHIISEIVESELYGE